MGPDRKVTTSFDMASTISEALGSYSSQVETNKQEGRDTLQSLEPTKDPEEKPPYSMQFRNRMDSMCGLRSFDRQSLK